MAGRHFADLDAAMQDEILVWIEAGEVAATWPVKPVIWFRMLVEHAMEGYYGDPGNGGNRDAVSWRMIGFEVRG
jgi:gluconate 2-dehydrogenase gamma chain